MDKPTNNAHAKFAPSGSHRWLVCHGSIALSEGIPERSSSYAQEGTECHEAAGLILNGAPWHKATEDLTEDQTEIVQEYTDYIFSTLDMLNDKFDNVKVWIEQSVKSNQCNEWAGTADCGILAGKTLGIFDLKAGFMPVTVVDSNGWINPQLGSYAVQFMDTHELWEKVDTVRLTIVQPRVYDKPQTHTISRVDLLKFRSMMLDHIKEIKAGDTTLVPGEHCGFCPAKGRCPALREAAIKNAKMVFDCPKEPKDYTNEEIAEILAEADMIEAHIEGVRQYARRELEKGRQVPGWKLVPKRAAYKWTDWPLALDTLLANGLTVDDIYTAKPKTPLQIQKVAKDNKKKINIDPFFVKESSGTTLAREDDKRDAVRPDPFSETNA